MRKNQQALLIIIFLLAFISCKSRSGSQHTEHITIVTQTDSLEIELEYNNENPIIDLNKPFNKGDTIYAKIISVIDGDTYDALTNRNIQFRIRMEGIDAPEKGMPHSKKSTSYLKSLTSDFPNVMIAITNIDRYKRAIAYTYLSDGRELSHEMIKAGYAWHYKEYNNEESLAQLEIEAQQQKLGLWADKDPMPPWEYRKLKREGKLPKD